MSSFVTQSNSGSLFKNTKKTEDKHPDYYGSLMVGTTEMQLAGWIKQGKNGTFLSLKLSEKYQAPSQSSQSSSSSNRVHNEDAIVLDNLPF
jgi:uncharacterized protein (DUF736 family)